MISQIGTYVRTYHPKRKLYPIICMINPTEAEPLSLPLFDQGLELFGGSNDTIIQLPQQIFDFNDGSCCCCSCCCSPDLLDRRNFWVAATIRTLSWYRRALISSMASLMACAFTRSSSSTSLVLADSSCSRIDSQDRIVTAAVASSSLSDARVGFCSYWKIGAGDKDFSVWIWGCGGGGVAYYYYGPSNIISYFFIYITCFTDANKLFLLSRLSPITCSRTSLLRKYLTSFITSWLVCHRHVQTC